MSTLMRQSLQYFVMRRVQERHDSWMLQAPLDGDRVEFLLHRLRSSYHLHMILPANCFLHRGRCGE